MIIVMKPRATEKSIERIVKKIEKAGMRAHVSKGTERTIIGAIGDERVLQQQLHIPLKSATNSGAFRPPVPE